MAHFLKIYIDRLKGGHLESIQETVPQDFMDIHEKELSFIKPVSVSGSAYLVGQELILRLKVSTEILLPCAICNEPIEFPIVLNDFCHAVDIGELKSSVFDYSSELREAILLQTPQFAECHNGNCPERESLKKFLKPARPKANPSQFPFSDLDCK